MSEPEIITTKDGRQYRVMPNGTRIRVSIVKMTKKQRKKLYAKMRAAVQEAGPPPEIETSNRRRNTLSISVKDLLITKLI